MKLVGAPVLLAKNLGGNGAPSLPARSCHPLCKGVTLTPRGTLENPWRIEGGSHAVTPSRALIPMDGHQQWSYAAHQMGPV